MDELVSDNVGRIKDTDIFKIKLCLSSLTNTVILCPMVSWLYTQTSADQETWTFLKRGVPGLVLIHDMQRRVSAAQICLADPNTGFAVWRENLHKTSNYRASQKNFHTFQMFSGGAGAMAGIKFPSNESATSFIKDVLSNLPEETSTEVTQASTKERFRFGRKLKKNEISSPCMFTHVSSISSKPINQPQPKTQKGKRGGGLKKYNGSGSSLDAPDADPPRHDGMPRRMSLPTRPTKR